MRVLRPVALALVLALVALLPFSAGAQAVSSPDRPAVSAKAVKVGTKIIKKNGKLFMVGRVTPAKGPVTIQKATKCNVKKGTCNFKFFAKTSVNKKGNYRIRVYAPQRGSWAWRAKVGASSSSIWVTCKQRSGSSPCPTP